MQPGLAIQQLSMSPAWPLIPSSLPRTPGKPVGCCGAWVHAPGSRAGPFVWARQSLGGGKEQGSHTFSHNHNFLALGRWVNGVIHGNTIATANFCLFPPFFSGGFFCSSVCVFASSFLLPVKSSLHFLEVPVQWGRGGPLGP